MYFFEDIASTFQFGKYNGLPLCYVIAQNPEYIYWCVNTIDEFQISEEALRQIKKLMPKFVIPISFEGHVCKRLSFKMDAPNDNDLENWKLENDSLTYDRYHGSYAQDEMGCSDDEIDTIFDGNPLAYWNID